MSAPDRPTAMLAIAPRVANRRSHSPAFAYVRSGARPAKEVGARWLLSQLSRKAWGESTLSIVTMPGIKWQWERELLAMREGRTVQERGRCRRTALYAIEGNSAIYAMSTATAPIGAGFWQYRERPPWSSWSMRTGLVRSYDLCEAEDFMRADTAPVDVAWFDFHGPLTRRRLSALHAFAPRVRDKLVVTVMEGRESAATMARVETAGGRAELLAAETGRAVTEAFHYRDTTNMVMVVLGAMA